LSIESLKQFQQCQWHCWNYFSGVNDPLIHITIDIYNHKIFLPKFSGVSDTMEAISVVLMRPPKWLWQFCVKFQCYQWHFWSLYDTPVISKRLCKSVSPFKGKIKQKYFNSKYPHTI
jgi:hypothetical protein